MSFSMWLATMLLLLLAVVWLATVIGRVWTHLRMRRHSRRFTAAVEPLLRAGQWADVIALSQSKRVRRSPIALTIGPGLATWLSQTERGTDIVLAWQITRISMSQCGDEQVVTARRGLRTLLVVGGTAALAAFLDGIYGLYNAAWALSITSPNALAAVSAGIEEALLMPAFGLLVCLLALWAAAWLARSLEKMRLEIGRTVTSVLDQLVRPSTTADRG